VILLTVKTQQVPFVQADEPRCTIEPISNGFSRMIVYYGFMEDPDVPFVLRTLQHPGFTYVPKETSFFLGRETVIASKQPGMPIWREKLFALMSRNATSATAYFCLPPERVVELGAQVEI
jgi:KUP system potassium uptake protein